MKIMRNENNISLKAKTAKNLGYVSLMNLSTKIVQLISTVVLMKMLLPYDYGIVAVGMILITIFRNIETFGINAAIIQKDKKDINEIVLGTGFIIMFSFALLLGLLTFIIAPYWAMFYSEPDVTWLMRFISLIFIVSSFGFIPDIQLRKHLDFKRYILPNLGRALTYAGAAIVFALLGFRYWSLVLGTFLGEVARVIIFNKVSPWRIRICFDKVVARDLLTFGIWIVISAVLYSTYSVIDNAFIGKVLGTTLLGYYAIAYRWGHFTSSNIRPIFQTVMFPTFSNIRNDLRKLHSGYLQSLGYVSLIVFPITLGWIILADKFILNIIGSKWQNAILPLQILSVSGLLRSLQIGGELFPALGRPKITTGIVAAQFVILCILIYPFILWNGLIGASMAVVLTFSFTTVYVFVKISRLIDLAVKKALKKLIVPLASSLCMGIVLFFLKQLSTTLISFSPVWEFLFLFIMGIISYFSFLYIFTWGEIANEIRNIMRIIRSEDMKNDSRTELDVIS